MTFRVKSYFFRKREGFPLKVLNFRQTFKLSLFCNMKEVFFIKMLLKRPKRINFDSLYTLRERNCIKCFFLLFLIKIEIENH